MARDLMQRAARGARFVAVVALGVAAILLSAAPASNPNTVSVIIAIGLGAGVVGLLMPQHYPRRPDAPSADGPSNDP